MKDWIIISFAVAGAYAFCGVVGSIIVGVWRYFADRSGTSGRYKHWSEED